MPTPVPAGGVHITPSPPGYRVVAVPGLGLSGAVPHRTLDLLRRPTSVVELPGFGLPATRDTPVGPIALAHLLVGRLNELDNRPIVLIGHSASCPIVTQVAAWHPERIAALVLLGPTTDPRARTWPALADRWLRTAIWEDPRQVPVLLRDYHRTGLGVMRRAMNAARHHRIGAVLPEVRCPVLVLRGRHDRIAAHDWITAVAATTPNGHHRSLPAGAHMLPLTHPDTLAATISTFLDNCVEPHAQTASHTTLVDPVVGDC